MKRGRIFLILGCVLLGVAVWYGATNQVNDETPLDPQGVSPGGAKALAQVLEARGVEVTIARSLADYHQAEVDDHTTVVVSQSENLGQKSLPALTEDDPGRLVFLDFSPGLSSELEYPQTASTFGEAKVEAACEGNYQDEFESLTLTVEVAYVMPSLAGCFPSDLGGWLVASPQSEVLVVGAGAAFSNRQIVVDDNAAIALRMLGQHPKLVWYVPSIADSPPSDAVGAAQEVPQWPVPALFLAGISMLTVMWWRGRRLGPLEQEALPVHVPSLETTTNRGHLYQFSGAKQHAFSQIQAATVTDLAARLQTGPDRAALVAALGDRTKRTHEELNRLLDPATSPTSNEEFTKLTHELSLLSQESDAT